MKKYMPLSEIESKPISRATTGFKELDFIYGYSEMSDGTIDWGIPKSRISLWAGTTGIGKSRLAIDVAKNVAKNIASYALNKVLYFQTEAELSDFASWTTNTHEYPNIYCSGENEIASMIDVMYEVCPKFIIIDSVNEIMEFATGNKREARMLINGDDKVVGLRKVCQDLGCHIILLGQLNQDGTIKGGTSLPHLVDVALNLTPDDSGCSRMFKVSVGVKHRCGRRDAHIYGNWSHEEDGVECVSCQRFFDNKWMETHPGELDVAPNRDSIGSKIMNYFRS
jgi:DNA repair protein RadA/Sms